MSNVVAFGYGKRSRVQGSGPVSYGYGGAVLVPFAILRDSREPGLLNNSKELSLAGLSSLINNNKISSRRLQVKASKTVSAAGASTTSTGTGETSKRDVNSVTNEFRMDKDSKESSVTKDSSEQDLNKVTKEIAEKYGES